MKLLEWNYKISQTESFCSHDYFSRPFKEEDIWITSVSSSKRVGSCPRVQAASAVGNPFPEDSHWTWEGWRDGETPAWQSWTFPRPPSWARNDFTDPTFPSAPGYKAPDQTARVEFLIFPLGSFPPGPNATAGPWECRRTEPQEAAGAADFPRVVFVGSPGSWARQIHG